MMGLYLRNSSEEKCRLDEYSNSNWLDQRILPTSSYMYLTYLTHLFPALLCNSRFHLSLLLQWAVCIPSESYHRFWQFSATPSLISTTSTSVFDRRVSRNTDLVSLIYFPTIERWHVPFWIRHRWRYATKFTRTCCPLSAQNGPCVMTR